MSPGAKENPRLARWLKHLLTARLPMSFLCRRSEAPGAAIAEAVVPTDRLIYLSHGEIRYRREGENVRFRAGALWTIPTGTRRSWTTPPGCALSWVEFSVLPGMGTLPLASAAFLPESAAAMERLIDTAPEKPPFFAEMELKHLLARLFREGQWHGAGREAAESDHSLGPVIAFMRDHLHEPDLLGRLPTAVGMSPHRLRVRFRNALQTSPGRYLEALRMQQGRFLLLTTPLSIKEIATQVGFEDPLYFSRRYRRHWNQPPSVNRTPNP